MTRFPLPPVPVLALTSALALAACGGGGGAPDTGRVNPPPGDGSPNGTEMERNPGSDGTPPSEDGTATTTDSGTTGTTGSPGTTGGGGGEEITDNTDNTDTTDRTTTPPVTLASLCTATSCRGVFWDPATDTPARGGSKYDDNGTPTDVPRYQFQASYVIAAADPPTTDTNARDEVVIALAERDARYAQATVEAIANVIALIRTGREGDPLDLTETDDDGVEQLLQWFAGAEIAAFLDQVKLGAPVSAFRATLPLTSVNPVAQIIAARGVSHDLRGAADEDFATIALLLVELGKYEARAEAARDAIDARLVVADALATRMAPVRDQASTTRTRITTEEGALNALRTELRVLLNYPGGLESLSDTTTPPGSSCIGQTACEARRDALQGDNGLIATKRGLLGRLRTTLAGLNRQLTEAGANANDQLINRLTTAESEIAYWLRLIAAAESDATAQQTADRAALDALPDDIESAKAAAIRTALEGIVNAPGATDPARARFARDGNLADLTAAGAAVFARAPNAAPDATPPATYADYGMWLEGTDAAPVLRTRMGLVDPDGAAPGSGDLTTPGSATYNGTAHGLSARTASGENPVTASGHFTAAVRLDATFGDSPTLGGTVTNFRGVSGQGGAHVGSWSIDLRPTGPRAGTGDIRTAPFDNVGTDGHPTDGGWSAYAYGAAGERPVGVYGGFEADFADGAAIGQFDATQ